MHCRHCVSPRLNSYVEIVNPETLDGQATLRLNWVTQDPALEETFHFVTITSRAQLGNAGTPELMYL